MNAGFFILVTTACLHNICCCWSSMACYSNKNCILIGWRCSNRMNIVVTMLRSILLVFFFFLELRAYLWIRPFIISVCCMLLKRICGSRGNVGEKFWKWSEKEICSSSLFQIWKEVFLFLFIFCTLLLLQKEFLFPPVLMLLNGVQKRIFIIPVSYYLLENLISWTRKFF